MEDKSNATLSARLRERIAREGAISFRDWMHAALYDEREGYYRREGFERWGRAGDYRTSPEQSPLYAATFARFFASLYTEEGSPSVWTIWEAGGGAGHFAHGVLKTLSHSHPQLFAAVRYILDETGEHSRALAQARLASFGERVEYLSLHESRAISDSGVIFANELLDALPVHRVTARGGRLRELFVETDDAGQFAWTERDPSTPLLAEYLERLNVHLAEGQLAEINLQAIDWLRRAAKIFSRGYLVLVDYGARVEELYDMSLRPQGSLRAFSRHRLLEDVLEAPGERDLTSTIDWTTVERVCREEGFEVLSFERQDKFLLRAGLLEELTRMTADAATPASSLTLSASAREMILPGGMGESFQVLVAGKRSRGISD